MTKVNVTVTASPDIIASFDTARKILGARGGFKASQSQAICFYWERVVIPVMVEDIKEIKRQQAKLKEKSGVALNPESNAEIEDNNQGLPLAGENPNISQGIDGVETL